MSPRRPTKPLRIAREWSTILVQSATFTVERVAVLDQLAYLESVQVQLASATMLSKMLKRHPDPLLSLKKSLLPAKPLLIVREWSMILVQNAASIVERVAVRARRACLENALVPPASVMIQRTLFPNRLWKPRNQL